MIMIEAHDDAELQCNPGACGEVDVTVSLFNL